MSNLAVTNDLFFDRTGMDSRRVEKLVGEALAGMDDGELFLEYSQSESVALDDGRIKSASFDTTQGFGLRAVAGEAAGYAHASELSGAGRRGIAAGAGQSGVGAGAGRRDDRRARAGLARRHAARGGRPRSRRRFQPQEDLDLLRPDRAAGRGEGRDRGR